LTGPEARPPSRPSSASNGENGITDQTEVQAAPSCLWWKFWGEPFDIRTTVTVISAIAAVISASTALMALTTARENFRADQRPVVWLTNDVGRPEFVPSVNQTDDTGQILWGWHFANYGKTPALRITFRHFISIEDNTAESYGAVDPSFGGPLPTNKIDFSTVVSRPGISRDEFNKLMKIDRSVGISGAIFYFDAYGKKYETTFCVKRLSTGAITYCKEGNDIK
jgi:hypothetical protein